MLATLPVHFSTVEQVLFSQGTTTRLLMACAMGGVVGAEREWRHKASGLRTNIMICLGAALFTVLSGVLGGSGNRAQVASNIVQGIGFLGAGLVLHMRNRTVGVTSAASVWMVAAIGMACGAGLYIEALLSTGIVYCALRFIGLLESRSEWKRFVMIYEVRGEDEGQMFDAVLGVLDRARIRLNIMERDRLGRMERVTFAVAANAVLHGRLLNELRASEGTDAVVAFPDEQED